MRLIHVAILFAVVSLYAGVPYSFKAKSPAVASEINANFIYLDSLLATKADNSVTEPKDTASQVVLSGSNPKFTISNKEYSTELGASMTSYVFPGGSYDWYVKNDKLNLQQFSFDGAAFFLPLLAISGYNIEFERSIIVNGDETLNGGLTATGPSTFNSDVTVQGTLYAKTPISQVPDYVFGKDYNLMSLSTIEEFTKQNQHLPGVPSAQEMGNGKFDLVGMNMILLKKIEELTLHVIRQQKEIDNLKLSR